jgi:hypothetical protein
MREQIRLCGAAAVGLFLTVVTSIPADPPPPPLTLPGEVKGKVETRWLGPHVSVTRRSIGASRTTSVQWYDPDGKLVRSLDGPHIDDQLGYVSVHDKGTTIIHAVNGNWQLRLPRKAGPAGYITATEDSRTFVHQFHPKEGEIAVDVYVAGKLAGTVGPFLQYQGHGVQLGPDGSVAFLAWKSEKKETPQVVVAGPDGKERFRADCDGPVISPSPAPDGAGVLVEDNSGGRVGRTFAFYTKMGKVSVRNVGPNAGLLIWLPGSTQSVMHTSIGSDYRFHLVDWAAGKQLWEIADPLPARVVGALPAVAVIPDRLLFGGRERMRIGNHDEPVRSLVALDVKTGQVDARWYPMPLRPSPDDGRLLRLGNDLYLLADDEFALIDRGQISAKKGGWK